MAPFGLKDTRSAIFEGFTLTASFAASQRAPIVRVSGSPVLLGPLASYLVEIPLFKALHWEDVWVLQYSLESRTFL